MALTAAQAETVRSAAHAARVFGKLRKPARVPYRPRWPFGARQRYLLALKQGLDRIEQLFDELTMPRIRAAFAARADAPADDLAGAFDDLRTAVGEALPDSRSTSIAADVARETAQHNREQLGRVFVSVAGFDPLVHEAPGIEAQLNAFMRDQVRLIQNLDGTLLDQLQQTVTSGLRSGMRVEELGRVLRERFGVARTRADLIAQDQVGKFTGELTRLRQTAIGIKQYTWSTANDERVRPMHAALNDTVQDWANAPITDRKGNRNHPGHDYRCRCTAIPVVDDLLAALGGNDNGTAQTAPTPPAPKPRRAPRPRPPKPAPTPPTAIQAPTPAPAPASPVPTTADAAAQQRARAVADAWATNRRDNGVAARGAVRDFIGRRYTFKLDVQTLRDPTIKTTRSRTNRGTRSSITGQVELAGHVRKDAEAAFKKIARTGTDAGLTWKERQAVKTVVHEEIHGYGPNPATTYRFAGKFVEEIATEVNARTVLVDMLGPHEVFDLPTQRPGIGFAGNPLRSGYDGWIAKAMDDLAAVTGWEPERVGQALRETARMYKSRPAVGIDRTRNANSALSEFVDDVPDLTQDQRIALGNRWRARVVSMRIK